MHAVTKAEVALRIARHVEAISSGELLGDLTEIPVLDKLSRIITLWNREVYRPRPQLPAKPVDPATVRLRRQPPL